MVIQRRSIASKYVCILIGSLVGSSHKKLSASVLTHLDRTTTSNLYQTVCKVLTTYTYVLEKGIYIVTFLD